MKKIQEYITNSAVETQKIAIDLAKSLKGGEVMCFYGDLGYGKTTFIQGMARGLGVKGRIISPTFIIMRTYRLEKLNFYHIDLYRIESENEVIDLGITDMMNKSENILAIEWPEKMGKLLTKNRIDIKFEYLDEDKRKITIERL